MLKAIISRRRTVKPENFNGQLITDELIDELLGAANWAPTHGQTEPWRFIVFAGKEGVKAFGKLHADLYQQETAPEQFLQKKYDTLLHKPDLSSHVIVAAMKRGDKDNIPEQEELAATACAVQNMLLTAGTCGLAAYWGTGGMCYHPALKNALGFGENDRIMGFLYLGYTDQPHPEGFRNSGIEEKVRYVRN